MFFPPFLLLLAVVVLNFTSKETFAEVMENANSWILDTFGHLFALAPFLMLLLCVAVYFSPFGRVIIGGPGAKPLLTKWRWFAIGLCTYIAVGILLHGAAEPMFHLSGPPASLGIEPGSPEAADFAMESVLFHWTFTPYAIYTVAVAMFAFAYYNMKEPFSMGSLLSPLLGSRGAAFIGPFVDVISLSALACAFAGGLGGCMLLMSGGLNHLYGIEGSPLVWAVIAAVAGAAFIISSITGLMRGIRVLSNINTVLLIGLMVFILVLGPTRFILFDGAKSFGRLMAGFVERNFWTITTDDIWARKWTIWLWAAWFAWAPISIVFLGRLCYGHSVRALIIFNLILPASFTGLWMAIFGGTALHLELFQNANLVQVLNESRIEGVLYAFMEHFPLVRLLIPTFLFIAFLSFVTCADSTTSAMSGLSSTGISPENPESSMAVKIAWGVTVGLVGWMMISFAHLDGIRMLASLGGLPAMLLFLVVMVCLIKVALNPKKYDAFKEGYDAAGRPIKR